MSVVAVGNALSFSQEKVTLLCLASYKRPSLYVRTHACYYTLFVAWDTGIRFCHSPLASCSLSNLKKKDAGIVFIVYLPALCHVSVTWLLSPWQHNCRYSNVTKLSYYRWVREHLVCDCRIWDFEIFFLRPLLLSGKYGWLGRSAEKVPGNLPERCLPSDHALSSPCHRGAGLSKGHTWVGGTCPVFLYYYNKGPALPLGQHFHKTENRYTGMYTYIYMYTCVCLFVWGPIFFSTGSEAGLLCWAGSGPLPVLGDFFKAPYSSHFWWVRLLQ